MKEKFKFKFKFKYFTVFFFLAILFLINSDTVFAGRVGGEFASQSTTNYRPAEDLQSKGKDACKIYISSNKLHPEQRQFSLGWKADIFANHEDFYSGNASSSNVAWTTFNDLIAYPNIILFEEKWKDYSSGKTYYKRSTGYLYMYVDSYEVKEIAAILASYANTDSDSYIPLYYQNSNSGNEGNGEAFFGFRGVMTYLPLSNIKCMSAGANYGAYYAQNFTTESQIDAVAVLEKIMTQGDSKQEANGWEAYNKKRE